MAHINAQIQIEFANNWHANIHFIFSIPSIFRINSNIFIIFPRLLPQSWHAIKLVYSNELPNPISKTSANAGKGIKWEIGTIVDAKMPLGYIPFCQPIQTILIAFEELNSAIYSEKRNFAEIIQIWV